MSKQSATMARPYRPEPMGASGEEWERSEAPIDKNSYTKDNHISLEFKSSIVQIIHQSSTFGNPNMILRKQRQQ